MHLLVFSYIIKYFNAFYIYSRLKISFMQSGFYIFMRRIMFNKNNCTETVFETLIFLSLIFKGSLSIYAFLLYEMKNLFSNDNDKNRTFLLPGVNDVISVSTEFIFCIFYELPKSS